MTCRLPTRNRRTTSTIRSSTVLGLPTITVPKYDVSQSRTGTKTPNQRVPATERGTPPRAAAPSIGAIVELRESSSDVTAQLIAAFKEAGYSDEIARKMAER